MARRTFLEIQAQIDQLQKEAEEARRKEAGDVLIRIKEAIAVYGFTAAELGFGSSLGKRQVRKIAGRKPVQKPAAKRVSAAAPKFRDQDGNVWSGRGPRPAWFKTALEAGKSPADLLVK